MAGLPSGSTKLATLALSVPVANAVLHADILFVYNNTSGVEQQGGLNLVLDGNTSSVTLGYPCKFLLGQDFQYAPINFGTAIGSHTLDLYAFGASPGISILTASIYNLKHYA